MEMSPAPKALVIGAGIGGLATGIALRRAGMAVEIFEQADTLRDVGAGISLWANAIHALDKLGLGDVIRSASLAYVIDGLRSSQGELLASVSAPELQRRLAVPLVVLHRADLLAALVAAFGREGLYLGRQCTGFHEDASGVTVEFADGSSVQGDLLVGADGLHSVIRTQLHGRQFPRYAGCTAWRAVVSFTAHPVPATESWGCGSVFGQVPMSGQRVYWYATKNMPPGQREANEKAALLEQFRGWHAPIEMLIEATDDAAILRNDIYDRQPLKSWGKGRVTLLGDAAHPMTPYLGQGGCQALEDAVVLAQSLREEGNIESGLRSYESKRIPRANALVSRSRAIGRIAQLQHPWACCLRNSLLKLLTPKLQASQLARIAGHRV
jgi:FAD-dependent urate hydroxylase